MKQLLTVVLKGCSYVGLSHCRLHVPSVFCWRAGFDVDANYVFSQSMLTAITLVGGTAGYGGTAQGVRQYFLSAHCPVRDKVCS